MAMFIVMPETAADIVQESISTTLPYYMPIRRGDGTVYILPIGILDQPAHVQWHGLLGELPQMDSADPAFPAAIDPPE